MEKFVIFVRQETELEELSVMAFIKVGFIGSCIYTAVTPSAPACFSMHYSIRHEH